MFITKYSHLTIYKIFYMKENMYKDTIHLLAQEAVMKLGHILTKAEMLIRHYT